MPIASNAALRQAALDLADTVGPNWSICRTGRGGLQHPLRYAWAPHAIYTSTIWPGDKSAWVFRGMNPGTWGMAQTGVPFRGNPRLCATDGSASQRTVNKPPQNTPSAPMKASACQRSEGERQRGFRGLLCGPSSGRRELFFKDHFVANYDPSSSWRRLRPTSRRTSFPGSGEGTRAGAARPPHSAD